MKSKSTERRSTALLGATALAAGLGAAVMVFGSVSGPTFASPCNPRNQIGYMSKEDCEVCRPGEGCFNAIPLVERAQKAASNGDLGKAITTMEEAVQLINSHRLGRIQRWDNLAELYCLRAVEEPDQSRAASLRQDGLAMLAEFRCGMRIQTGATACALPSGGGKDDIPSSAGLVPNPTLAPMCFETMCERGFQSDAQDEFPDPIVAGNRSDWESHYEEMGDIADDAANLSEIEALCRKGQAP